LKPAAPGLTFRHADRADEPLRPLYPGSTSRWRRAASCRRSRPWVCSSNIKQNADLYPRQRRAADEGALSQPGVHAAFRKNSSVPANFTHEFLTAATRWSQHFEFADEAAARRGVSMTQSTRRPEDPRRADVHGRILRASGKAEAECWGMPGLGLAIVPASGSPSWAPEDIAKVAETVFPDLVHLLETDAGQARRGRQEARRAAQVAAALHTRCSRATSTRPTHLHCSGRLDGYEAINKLFYQRGWTDGLPIVPPTQERYERMIARAGSIPTRCWARSSRGSAPRPSARSRSTPSWRGASRRTCLVVVAAVRGDYPAAVQSQGAAVHDPSRDRDDAGQRADHRKRSTSTAPTTAWARASWPTR